MKNQAVNYLICKPLLVKCFFANFVLNTKYQLNLNPKKIKKINS